MSENNAAWSMPRWRTIDIVSTAILGVAFGVAFWGWDQVYAVLDGFRAFAGPYSGLLGGPWLMAGLVAGLLVRRPGAAVFAEVLAATVEALLGNKWGASTIVSGLLQGLGVEVVLAIFAFRLFKPWVAMLAGAAAAAIESVYEWGIWYADWTPAARWQYLGWFSVSGAVFGLLAWLLVKALARTGAVDALPAGREAAVRARASETPA